MASTAQKSEWWASWRCTPDKMARVAFPGDGRVWNLLVADASVPAWETFVSIMDAHDYRFREGAGGTYNCRRIGGSTTWSLHAYGIALDLNPSVNRFGQNSHDFPQGFIDDVLATGLFRWGQEFDDPMHWEIDVPPDEIGDEMAVKIPLESWAIAAFTWAIENGVYTEQTDLDKVREPYEFQQLMVGLWRVADGRKGHFPTGDGGTDSAARAQAKRANDRLDGIKVPD